MKSYLWFFILIVAVINPIISQTIISEGEVTGIWDKSGSPYLINAEINIPEGDTLVINSGVRVEFQGHHRFRVYGSLYAIGHLSDSIFFTSKDTATQWSGFRFYKSKNYENCSILDYCVIENSYAYSGNLPRYYTEDDKGGGIYTHRAQLNINNCSIRNNQAFIGGAVVCGENTTMKNTFITNNTAIYKQIILAEGDSKIIGCQISENTANQDVLAIYENVLFLNNTVCNNFIVDPLYSLLHTTHEPKYVNSIFYYNSSKNINISGSLNPSFYNCNIEGGITSIYDPFADIKGVFNGIYSDNIDSPPVFNNVQNGDYQLAKSPCINGGSQNIWYEDFNSDILGNPRIYNGISPRIDIGAFEFQEKTPNRRPIAYLIDEFFVIRSQKRQITIPYFDPDEQDSHAFEVFTNNTHVTPELVSDSDSSIIIDLIPADGWNGDCNLTVRINDDSNSENSTFIDSMIIYVGNEFEGTIYNDVIFSDTIRITGDIIVEDSASLLLEKGALLEFQGYFKVVCYGKINALGSAEQPVTFNAVDTSMIMEGGQVREQGWAGIVITKVNREDTMKFDHCYFINAGFDNEFWYSNGTITIDSSSNIRFYKCVFESNSSSREMKNSGIVMSNSSNIVIRGCSFTKGITSTHIGIYIDSYFSDFVFDSCKVFDTNSYYNQNSYLIHTNGGDFNIQNSEFYNNHCPGITPWTDGDCVIEKNYFHDNSNGTLIECYDCLIRNNTILNTRGYCCDGLIVCKGSDIIGNVIAYNNNLLHIGNYVASAIYVNHGNARILNNTIVKNINSSQGAAIYSTYCAPYIANNIVWDNDKEGIKWYNDPDMTKPTIVNNVIRGGYPQNIGNNHSFEPQFRLNDSLDFQLSENSQCINKGIYDSDIFTFLPYSDLLGNNRFDTIYNKLDIGAYEFQGPFNTANIDRIKRTNDRNHQSLKVFPNPTREILFLTEDYIDSNYSILNLYGQIVKSGLLTQNSIPLEGIEPGHYLLLITTNRKVFRNSFTKL